MKSEFFAANRQKLSGILDGCLAVLAASDLTQKTGDMANDFAQESNFWYLTGIEEAGWQLIMLGEKSWLVSPETDEVHRVFNGALSDEAALRRSLVDEVIDGAAAQDLLHTLAKDNTTVYTLGAHPNAKYFGFVENPALARLRRRLKNTFTEVKDCRKPIAKLRAIKLPEEIDTLQRNIDHTCRAFELAKDKLGEMEYEYQLEAIFWHDFRSHGLSHGYSPIVAAGINACTLHYGENNQPIKDGSLVLLDIGATSDGYSADITRTWSKGDPSARQRAIHSAVQAAHFEIIDLLKPGCLMKDYLTEVDIIMKRALESVGLANGGDDYRRYFPHAISHGLGVDVHDSLGGFEEFQPGMVLTVEPGIYVPEEGIGVRIEDDILITSDGHRNMSATLSTEL